MTFRCTAVVVDPSVPPNADGIVPGELFQFHVGQWYEALDMLCFKWAERFPLLKPLGVDHLELRAFSLIHEDD